MATGKDQLEQIGLRWATTDDRTALEQLAILDGAMPLHGPILVAEIGGIIAAAVGLDGRAIADPFVPTRDVIDLLVYRQAQSRPRQSERSRSTRLGRGAGRRSVTAEMRSG